MGDFNKAFGVTAEERLAMAAGKDVQARDNGANYLSEPGGTELHWDGLKRPSAQHAMLSDGGSGVHPADRMGMQGTAAAHAASYQAPPPRAPRDVTPEDLMNQARQMLDNQGQATQGQMRAGPSTGVRDDAGGRVPDWLRAEMEKDNH